MVETNFKCKCGKAGAIQDKRFPSNILCTDCFATRRKEACKAGDDIWFEKNIPVAEMTPEERQATGI